ncbi:MAG: hypothetical protein JXA96_03255 [Sedimentisphaerales bacterium]|nr:hypothetical protein [Sedimentisphaerales bacterium]
MKKIIMRIIILMTLLCSTLQASKVWDVGDPIQAGTISSPVFLGRYLCGSSVDFSVSGTNDYDHWCDPIAGTEDTERDTLSLSYPIWTASAGAWKDGDNVGEDVVWLAPNSYTTDIDVNMYDNDWPYSIPDEEDGTRDDLEIHVSKHRISAIKPYLYAANYGGDHPIYDVAVPEYSYPDGRNEPSAWSMGANPYVSVKFSHSFNLTQAEDSIVVTGQTSGDAYNIGDWDMTGSYLTWSTWPTSYINCESGSNIDNVVTYKDYTTGWYYRCKDGTDDWILMTDQSSRLYVVYDDPLCDYYIFNKNNLDTVIVDWVNGCTKVDTSNDSDNIPRKVQLGAKSWFSPENYDYGWGIVPDPFEWLAENPGDCSTYADLMTKGLLILGVSASYVEIQCRDILDNRHAFFTSDLYPFWSDDNGDADGDGTLNKDESGWSGGTGTLEEIYRDGDLESYEWIQANYPWSHHGACECAGHWWEITFNSDPDHQTEEIMTSYPHGPVIDYPSILMPGGSF